MTDEFGPKMSVLKEMYDSALMSRKKKTPKSVMRKEDGDFSGSADQFEGFEHKPSLTITLISGSGLPDSDMLEEAKEGAADNEKEEESEGDLYNKGKGLMA